MSDDQLLNDTKADVLALLRDLPYYSEQEAPIRDSFQRKSDIPDFINPYEKDMRYKRVVERLAYAYHDASNIGEPALREILYESQKEVRSIRESEERVTARELALRFVQELLDNRSHHTMVQRLSFEISRLDRGQIDDETLAQILTRAKLEYVQTLDNSI